MPQSNGRVPCWWWSDETMRALTGHAQWTLMMLRSQPDLTLIGTLGLNVARWANYSQNGDVDLINRSLVELASEGLILCDFCTQEVVVRRFMLHDQSFSNPKWARGAARAIRALLSLDLASAIISEAPPPVRKAIDDLSVGKANEQALINGKSTDSTPPPPPPPLPTSSHPLLQQEQPPTPVDNEDEERPIIGNAAEDPRIEATFQHLADRDLKRGQALGTVRDPHAYYRKCLEGRRLKDAAAVATFAAAHPDWAADRISRNVELPEVNTPPEYIPDRFRDFEAEDRERDGWWSP